MNYERDCEHCGNTFQAKRKDKRFCSSTCRAKHSQAKGLGAVAEDQEENLHEPGPIKSKPVTLPPAADPASQFIISSQQKEIDRFEQLYNEERKAKKEYKKLNAELRDKIREMEMAQQLAKVASESKPNLGFLDTPVGQGLIQHLGPAMGVLATGVAESALERFKSRSASAPQMAGLENTPFAGFVNWYATQPADIQEALAAHINLFMQLQGTTLYSAILQATNLIAPMRAA